jgi:hypothetical protein
VPIETIPEVAKTTQAISVILAPAIMISASALMILALQGKYSQLIDRLRALNDERRHLVQTPEQTRLTLRLENVIAQIEIILLRARLVRNSIVSLYVAIATFILASIAIGVPLTFNITFPASSALVVFMLGMISVFTGTSYALRDIGCAYKVALIKCEE